jgi:hypothetical protein
MMRALENLINRFRRDPLAIDQVGFRGPALPALIAAIGTLHQCNNPIAIRRRG